ncbi:hypothetical protein [Aquihabitans sp. McL0605]|uniref:hypothetical protein n=1 Tax=Aquihabitans sp. McL0605 TaxID=3415671 RepID=UPI003CEA654E
MAVRTAPIVFVSLVGGYAVGKATKDRRLAGAVMASGATIAKTQWAKTSGVATTALLSGIFYGSFGASHPLAKKIGAWPAVLTAAGVSAASAHLLNDRKLAAPASA